LKITKVSLKIMGIIHLEALIWWGLQLSLAFERQLQPLIICAAQAQEKRHEIQTSQV
jgi:hypothetical protein